MHLIVTVTRADEVRRAKSRFSRPVSLRVFPHNPSIRDIDSTSRLRRVGVWRGGFRLSMSVAAPFVWRCLSGAAVAPFPHPPHRTGHADLPHPALGQDLT